MHFRYTTLVILLLFFFIAKPAWSATTIHVNVEGVEGEALKNVMAYLTIAHQKEDTDLSKRQVHYLHHKGPNEIKSALEVYGYYKAKIDAELKEHNNNAWEARYLINPGPRIKVGVIDLEILGDGAKDTLFQNLKKDFPIKENDPLSQASYEKGKDELQKLAHEHGYFDAKFTQQRLQINLKTYLATPVLHFDTGSRYRFGQVEFINDRTMQQCEDGVETQEIPSKKGIIESELLVRYIRFKEGDPYKNASLADLQSALIDSNYYSEVEVEPCPERAVNLEVPIFVYLTANTHHHYSAGAGFGTNTGPRFNIGWEDRYVNEHGHKFSFGIRASTINQVFNLGYAIPVGDPRTDQFRIDSSYGRRMTVTSDDEIGQIGIRHIAALSNGWQRTAFLDFRRERYHISGVAGGLAGFLNMGKRYDGGDSGLSYLLTPGISWFHTEADNFVYPRKGYRFNVEVSGASSYAGSTSSFVQATAEGKFIHSIGERSRFLFRGNAGVTWAPNFSKLPPSIRYFTGGDNTIRGYNFEAIGPKNENGQVIGGKNLLVGSIEYDYRFLDKWLIAGFYDAGNAFTGFNLDVQQGAGVGVRWLSPIGPVHLDLAYAVTRPGDHIRLHFYLGPDL
ncbi:autotransporter assembly complex protein TamA [Candidatus Nitrosacidococcus sp. I8]|uniref:autotransporter assembly complex protein TamA n=1 Tax=Candidatus Nitrosacidococcus sp. I8 TaxID=2942908 RepID=UPI00222695EC|nr:autotransporter assembly complex family protein [Candidatus Nitrosacidococcus sp. I8]